MAPGLRVRNQFFTTQIDHNFKNYGFQQIIPMVVSITSPSVDEQGLVQVTVPGVNALVGVRTQLFFYIPLGSYFDGANWTYTFKFMYEFGFTGTISDTVQFYVFNSPEGGAYSNVGIRIRHPVTGELGFHSDMRPLYMEAHRPCTVAFTGAAGNIYCPIVTRVCFINNFYSGIGYRNEPYALRCVGSGIQVKQTSLSSTYLAFFEYYDAGQYAVINVTGLA